MNYKLLRFYLLLAIWFSFEVVNAQNEFNKIFLYDQEIIRNEILHESDDAYYAIGYADDNSNITVGIHVSKHDKISGAVLNTTYFAIDSTWSFLEHSNDVYQEGNSLFFGFKGDQLYTLEYNLLTAEINIVDEIPFPSDWTGVYLHDLLTFNDTSLYVTTCYLEGDSTHLGFYLTYPDGTHEFKHLPRTDSLKSLGLMMKRENGNYMLFSHLKGENLFWDRSLAFFELDKDFNVLNNYYTVSTDGYITPKSILPINNEEVLVLAAFYDWDNIRGMHAYSHQILRYHIDNREIIWSSNYGFPASNGLLGGKIVASHEEDHYLYCTSAVRADATVDSFSTVGRVVKIDDNGEQIWQKDYAYYTNHRDDHSLYDIIATSDGNYLVGGKAQADHTYGWLLKINESGEIVSDSLVNVTWTDNDWTKNIQIYPNPTVDHIYINQNAVDDITYHLYDVQGNAIDHLNINAKDQGVIWDVSDLISGSYFIRMVKEGKVIGSTVLIKQGG